jgi:predicted CopG family antitoxin
MSKLITVPDVLYDELSKAKGDEPFSKLLEEMLEVYRKSIDIRQFAGVLKDRDVKPWLKDVENGRKRGFKRHIKNL